MVGFIIGLVAGGCIGAIVMAMLSANRVTEAQAEARKIIGQQK